MARPDEIKGTSVAYHSDGFRGGRPAINVKVHDRDMDGYEQLEASMGEKRAQELYEIAEEFVGRWWWEAAEQEANELGLGPIEQEGRSGGWLVFTDGRDPLEFGGKPRLDWLRAYSAMVEFCRESLAEIPAEIQREAEELANSQAVAP
jgi:hypothetical protein